MQAQNNRPKERKIKRDYFFIFAYILVALVLVSQIIAIFGMDILEALGVI